MILQCKCIR